MSKSLLKRIVAFAGILVSFLFILLIKVKTSCVTRGIDGIATKGFFEFVNASSNINSFRHARIHMLIGFSLMLLAVLYFGFLLILEILNKRRILKNFSLFTKVVSGAVIFCVFIVILAGVDQESSYGDITHITLFGFPWVMSLLFSCTPLVSEYAIKR